MYAIDGEIIETMEDLSADTALLIVSDDRFHFKGIVNSREKMHSKELRGENSRDALMKINHKWTNQKYLEWVERICDKLEVGNMQMVLWKHVNNQYQLDNSSYRHHIQLKLLANV